MSDRSNASTGGGVGVVGLLGVLFVALKLLGVITWSWWWVLLPFWGGLAILLAGVIVFLVIWGIGTLLDK